MKCMKCGIGIQTGQVFCAECQADMEKHPVKPGTPVLLPRREKQPVVKRSRRRVPKPEEQITGLRRIVLMLSVLCIVLALALSFCIHTILTNYPADNPAELPGQNYGTSTPAE